MSDIMIGLVAAQRAVAGRPADAARRSYATFLRPAVVVLILWCVIEQILSSFGITALRDSAPYYYSICVFLVPPIRAERQARLSHWITAVLIFHAAWCSLALAVPSLLAHLPILGGQIGLFEPRNDFDGAVCGIFAAYCLHKALSGRSILINVALAAWNAVVVLYLNERAGLLGMFFAFVVLVGLMFERRNLTRTARAKALVPVILICLPLLYAVGSQTPTAQRMLAVVQPYVPFLHASPKYAASTGTEHAREKAWGRVAHYLEESHTREVVGVGFGANFMHESGADILLLGGPSTDVRSPHNYFVGTWARLGIIGLGIVSVIVLLGIWLAVLVKRRNSVLTDVDVLAMMVIVSLPAAAAVGVILESPFGAVPYFWALGHLSMRSSRSPGDEEAVAAGQVRPGRSSKGAAV